MKAMEQGRIHRLLRLITMLQGGTSLSAAGLADRLSVSRRTLFRDFKALETAGVPVRHTNGRGYEIEPGFFLPPVNLKVNEALGLMLLARLAEDQGGQPFYRAAVEGARKLAATLPAPYRAVTAEVLSRVTMAAGPASKAGDDAERFIALQKALDERRVCRMTYDSLFDGAPIQTDLRPYHLHYAVRAWYVIGHSAAHDEARTFKLARVVELETTGERFDRPAFDIGQYLGNAWSLIPEGRDYRVELLFTPKVARNVAEVRWHATQRHQMLDDGRCVMHFTIDGLEEITWWLLGYGDQVFVRKPAALRKRVADTHAAAAKLNARTQR